MRRHKANRVPGQDTNLASPGAKKTGGRVAGIRLKQEVQSRRGSLVGPTEESAFYAAVMGAQEGVCMQGGKGIEFAF